MADSGRLDRIETRLDRIEAEMRNLMAAIEDARSDRRGAFAPAPGAVEPPSPSSPPPPPSQSPSLPPPTVPSRPKTDAPVAARGAGRDLEAWFGENALLVVGVLALVASVGFALKYAFDQGWISPGLRVLAGLAIGLGLAVYGELAQRRGLRRFGAAAVGGGAAIAYLAVWAAAGPYAFVPPGAGIAAMVVLSGFALASAWRSDEAYVAAIAAAGALLAPYVLGNASTSADLLLAYTAIIAFALGAVAAGKQWRLTMGIVLVGFFGTAMVAQGVADDAWMAAYLAAGGAATVVVARRREWEFFEVAAWAAAWLGLLVTATSVEGWRGWCLLAAPALLAGPGWLAATRARASRRHQRGMVVISAALWTVVGLTPLPVPAHEYPLLIAAGIASLYIVPGLRRGIPTLAVAAVVVLALGVPAQWGGEMVILGWAVIVAAVAILTQRRSLARVRPIGLLLSMFASLTFVAYDLIERAPEDAAFVGTGALALYGLAAALAILARRGWDERNRRMVDGLAIDLQVVTWLLTGLLLFVGVSIEITRLELNPLATGLAVSAFWLVYAGVLLGYGFGTDRKGVRVTGLVVASVAIYKVVFYDLSKLDALYRVGSFALLAVITLVGAYAYHSRAKRREEA